MEEECVNPGVRNNNGKGGRSTYPSLSMVMVLAAVFIVRYSIIAMRLGVASESRVIVTWQHVFVWCQYASGDVTLLTGRPICVTAHVSVPVTESNVRHHAVF